MNDAAGGQHLMINAASGKTTTVAANMFTQVAVNENQSIAGSQSRSIGGSERVSVKQAYLSSVGSQSISVGGMQSIYVKGHQKIGVGAETVVVGGALLEKVGNPAAGAVALAKAAAIQGTAEFLRGLGPFGQQAAKAFPIVEGAVEAGLKGGSGAAWSSLEESGKGMAAGMVPGADAVLASVQGAGATAAKKAAPAASGDAAGGGGAAGASDAAGAGGPGPGHRNTQVSGAMVELIGGSYSIATPGSIGWKTTGAATILVGGGRAVVASKGGSTVMGVSTQLLGSLSIAAATKIARGIKGSLNTTIGGTLSSKAGGSHGISSKGTATFDVGGSLELGGGKVRFEVGGASVTFDGGGVAIEATTIKITGKSTHSSKLVHS